MEYAEKLSSNAADMTKADGLRSSEHGFSDKEIMDITLAAAARNCLSRSVLALGVELYGLPPSSSRAAGRALGSAGNAPGLAALPTTELRAGGGS